MKFKKIEISAFRIYDDPEDATFDFSLKDGDVADFVSIYAPNGFGKTSFYDAVEWGMTNFVQRFWQHKNITDDSLNKLKALTNDEIKLLKNKYSERPTYVQITDDKGKLIERSYESRSRIDLCYKDERQIERKEFQKVILSQEWITSFLKEEDGKNRYIKFVKNPEYEVVDSYFKNVNVLNTICGERMEDMKREIALLKNKVKDFEETNILENINSLITAIKEVESNSKLQLISPSASQKEIIDLKSLIKAQIVQYSNETDITEIFRNLRILKSGDESLHIIGIDKFFMNIESARKIVEDLTNIDTNLKKFDNLEKDRNRLKNNQALQDKLLQVRDRVEAIISEFCEYQSVFNDIRLKEADLIAKKEECRELQVQIENTTLEWEEIRVKHTNLLREISEHKDSLLKLSDLEKEENELEKKITSLVSELEKLNIDYKTGIDNLKIENQKIADYKHVLKDIEGDDFIAIEDYPDLQDTINGWQECIVKIKNKNEDILIIEAKIEGQKAFNSILEEFIKSGLSLVNEQRLSKCPLCEQVYTSYEALADQISKNSALSEVMQELTDKNNKLKQELLQLSEKKDSYVKNMRDFFTKKIHQAEENKRLSEVSVSKQKKEIDTKESNLKELRGQKQNYRTSVEGLSYDEYRNKLNDLLVKKEQSENELKSVLEAKDEVLKGQKNNLGILQANIDNIQNGIQSLQNNITYQKVIEWYKSNYPEIVIKDQLADQTLLENKRSSVQLEIEKVKEENLKLQSSIGTLEEELKCLDKDFLLKEKEYREDWKIKTEKENSSYKYFLKDKINYTFKEDNKEDLLKAIEKIEAETKNKLEKTRLLCGEYQKLDRYNDIIEPFLESEKVKPEINRLEEELKFYERKVKSRIEKEIDKTKNYLNNKVKDFLYEDLLQKIYQRIDPHPNFKSVRFELNLDGEVPTLDVFTKRLNDDEIIIPNLYFSTAQINVLCLSLCLASALNSKEYDCIFIDDPVQSMDSINVLSTIDLLRSIAFGLKKQIILSTHDENFHNLLKKKMPPDSFKSKFIELESFGKVKRT